MKLIRFQPRPTEDSRENPEHLVRRTLLENLDSLYATGYRLTQRPDVAEDLVQETARRALKASTTLKSTRNIRGWLFSILVNAARDHMRRGETWQEVDAEDCEPEPQAELESISLAAVQDVRRALVELGPAQRAVVVLVDIEEFTISETAQMLELPPGTVASRLSRARQELRARLQAYRSEASQGGGQP